MKKPKQHDIERRTKDRLYWQTAFGRKAEVFRYRGHVFVIIESLDGYAPTYWAELVKDRYSRYLYNGSPREPGAWAHQSNFKSRRQAIASARQYAKLH